jgi:hypothetical protein
MGREYISIRQDFSIQSNFTDYSAGIHNGILNRGWNAVTQTGEIDPLTVTVPSSNTYAGFKMYSTNDGVGTQFFMRIDYGRSSNNSHHKTKITIGTGNNGSGTLTGNVSHAYELIEAAAAPTNPQRSIVAGDAGRFVWVRNIDQVTFWEWIVVARTVDATGAPNSNGMEIFQWGGIIPNPTGEFVPAPGYSSVLHGYTWIRGPLPLHNGTQGFDTGFVSWRLGLKSFFAHPVNVHQVDSQYPNPYLAIVDPGRRQVLSQAGSTDSRAMG